ncbi:MAG: peptide chain release factor N(5)-glutamine methyltransferase [Phycisphaerae bacterium]|nr:peptide chain release factor N(5)-glutamine methyltransferase [Phycisphaerae bacterium]
MATESWTTRSLRDWMRGFLQQKGIESAPACADLLLSHVAGCERMHLYMEPDRPWTAEELATLRALVARAARHEPVQFLVGSWGFHAADFEVAPCTLIPRPSTETLVDAALEWISQQPPESVRSAIDLGTGTGCIALSILRALRGRQRKGRVLARASQSRSSQQPEVAEGSDDRPFDPAVVQAIQIDGEALRTDPSATHAVQIDDEALRTDSTATHAVQIDDEEPRTDPSVARANALACDALPTFVLTDLVPEAIELSKRNAQRHGLTDRCSFRVGDAWSALERSDGPFDLVVSNPPYISDAEFSQLAPNVAEWEPRTALHGGASGLEVVQRIVRGATAHMRPGGLLLVEIAASQERAALDLARSCGLLHAAVLRDSDDLPRVLRALTPA